MYGVIVELVVVAAVIVLVNGDTVKYYATKYDHLDIERILNNRRMVNYYAQCLLSKGPCPPQGVEFKRILPEALETNCLRCTEKQKVVTYRSIKRLKKEYPKVWLELQEKWDPNDVYVKRFEETYRNPTPTTTNENEILLDDRFGVIDVTTRKPTTKIYTKKPQKPKYSTAAPPITTTQNPRPSINSFSTTVFQNRPSGFYPYNPNVGGVISNKQVGDTGSTKNYNSVSTMMSITTENNTKIEVTSQLAVTSKNAQPSEITPTFPIVNITDTAIGYTPKIPTVISSSNPFPINIPQVRPSDKTSESSTTEVSPEAPLLINLFTSNTKPVSPSSLQSNVKKVTVVSTTRKPIVNSVKSGVTFDIPPSSLSNSLTLTILQNSPITANSKPVTANFPEVAPTVSTLRPAVSFQTDVSSGNRQPDVISQVLSSFFNNNRPPSVLTGASVNKTNEAGTRTGLQIRLPSISISSDAEVFNPFGNIVRDITSVGGRLLETGTSIADSFLSSVRTLFTPPGRRNRQAQNRSPSP